MQALKKRTLKLWAIFAPLGVVAIASAVGSYFYWFAPPTQQQIDEALAKKNWRRAASLIRRSDLKADGGRNSYSLGVAYRNMGDSDRAIQAFMGADDKSYRTAEACYAIASLYAAGGQDDLAVQWLRDAYEAGMTDSDRLFADKSLKKFKDSDAWKQILKLEKQDRPHGESALSFLIGDWTASTALGGNRRNVVFKYEIPGRVVSESWSGANTANMTAMFLQDPATQKWTYRSVDTLGRTFTGDVSLSDQVTISGTYRYIDGTEYLRTVHYKTAGDVINYSVTDSKDGGKTWNRPTLLRLSILADNPLPGF